MSDLSAGYDALEQLDERIRRLGARLADQMPDAGARLCCLGSMNAAATRQVLKRVDASQPACESAAAEAGVLAARLGDLASHPALGLGEARAALSEAVAALQHQREVLRDQCRVLAELRLAQRCPEAAAAEGQLQPLPLQPGR